MRSAATLFTLLTIFAPLAIGAPRAAQDEAPADVPQGTAITIDGTHIPFSEFGPWLLQIRGNNLLDEYMNERLLELEAQRLGVEPTPEEVHARVYVHINERIAKAFGGKREPWLLEIGRLGLTEEQYVAARTTEELTRTRGESILAETRIISDSDVQELFDRRYGRNGRRIWLRAIRLRVIVPTPPGRTTVGQRRKLAEEARAKLAKRLEDIRKDILAKKSEFHMVAADISEHEETKKRAGEFPSSFRPADWPTEVADVVYALEPGEISAPVYSNGFYSIFQTLREEQVSYDDLADELREELRKTSANLGEMDRLVRRLSDQHPLEARPELLTTGAADDTVFTLGEEQISRDQFSRWIARRVATSLVRPFVQDWLTLRAARRTGVEIEDEVLAERLEALRVQIVARLFSGKLEKWHMDLASKGTDEDGWRRTRGHSLRLELLAETMIKEARVVIPLSVKNLWEERYGTAGKTLDVRMIRKVIQLPEDARTKGPEEVQRIFAAESAKLIAELEDVRERAEEGEDFASLVERFSDDEASRAVGGRIPGGFRSRPWPEEVKLALAKAKIGEITAPLSVLDAVFIFELTGVKSVALESVEKDLRTELENAPANSVERANWLRGMLDGIEWELHPAAFD